MAALVALLISPIGVTNAVEAENQCQNVGTIFISEIGWAGSSKSSVDEWLEIANAGENEINISGWTIEGAGTGGSKLTLPEGAWVLPRSVYLVANYSSENSNSILAASPNYINTAVSLSNSSLHLILKDTTACQIDEVGDGNAPFFGGTSTAGTVSMVRVQPIYNGTLAESWTAAESSNGFDSEVTDLGTPGSVNWFEVSPPSLEASYGEAKDEGSGVVGMTATEEAGEAGNVGEASEATNAPEATVAETTSVNDVPETPVVTEEISAPESIAISEEIFVSEIPNSEAEQTVESEISVVSETVIETIVDETETVTETSSSSPPAPLLGGEGGTEVTTEIVEMISDPITTSTPDSTTETEIITEPEITEVITEVSETSQVLEATPVETSEASEVGEAGNAGEAAETTEAAEATEAPEATETVEVEVETEIPVVSYSHGALLINEFVSDPVSGQKEWVEIINPNTETISLSGWKVAESSGRTALLPDILLEKNKITATEFSSNILNNGGDEIFLLDPEGKIIDSLTYGTEEIPAAGDPNSVARNSEGNFVETETPTRGLVNVITATEVSPSTSSDSAQDLGEATGALEAGEAGNAGEASETTTENVSETGIVSAQNFATPPTVRLSELYPNTDGADSTDEFIELENYGQEIVNLSGLILEDAAGNNWTFPEQIEITAGGFYSTKRTEFQFALNNSGSETVSLYAADGTLLDQIQYENAPKKFTYSRSGDVWLWASQPTPNESNVFPQTLETEDNGLVRQASTDTTTNQRTTTTKSPVRVTISEARALKADTKIIIEGVVSALPGIFGEQLLYIIGDGAGIQVYKSDGNFPDLNIGDRIEFNSTTSSIRGEPRIKITKDEEITILENNVALATLETETVSEKEAGQLVRLAGLITEKSSDRFTIETDSGLSEVRIKTGTNIDLSEIKPGIKISVTGIVGQSAEKYFLLPRSQEDLVVEKPVENISTAISAEPTDKETGEQANQIKAIIIGTLVIVGLTAYATRKRWLTKKQTYDKASKLSFAPTG